MQTLMPAPLKPRNRQGWPACSILVSAPWRDLPRVWKGATDITAPISENQFRWLLYAGALLMGLPVATKVATDITGLEFTSSGRRVAQEICRDQQQSFVQSVRINALEDRIDNLGSALAELRNADHTGARGPASLQPEMFVQTLSEPDILGRAVSILYRSQRNANAEIIAAILQDARAAVARRATDLSETATAQSARRGDIFLLSDARTGDAARAIERVLAAAGLSVTQNNTLAALSGTAIQILLY